VRLELRTPGRLTFEEPRRSPRSWPPATGPSIQRVGSDDEGLRIACSRVARTMRRLQPRQAVEGWTRERIGRTLSSRTRSDRRLPASAGSVPRGLVLNDCWTETTRATSRRWRGTTTWTTRSSPARPRGARLRLRSRADRRGMDAPPPGGADVHGGACRLPEPGRRRAPAETATVRNPYANGSARRSARHVGYVAPGDRRSGPARVRRRVALAHGQRIYGEMWAAALIAIAFAAPDLRAALEASLGSAQRSRLAEALRDVLAMHAAGSTWTEARDAIEERTATTTRAHDQQRGGRRRGAAMGRRRLLAHDRLAWRAAGHGLQRRDGRLDLRRGVRCGCAATALVDPLDDRIRTAILGFDDSASATWRPDPRPGPAPSGDGRRPPRRRLRGGRRCSRSLEPSVP